MILLRPRLALAFASHDPGAEFKVGSTRFRAMTEGYLEAFYDRVFDTRHAFVGFEVTPIDDRLGLPTQTSKLDYVTIHDGGKRFRILTGQVKSDVTSTADQAFGGRIYSSALGEIALSIELDWMDEADLETLKGADVDWVSVIGASP